MPTLNRRLHDLRCIALRVKRSPMTPLQACEAILENRFLHPEVRSFFANLPDDERHYWIASLYALLMPKARRRRLAAYFTPPHLAHHAIDALLEAGIKPGHHRILDPASGGAAFLVPLAARILRQGRQRGSRAKTIVQTIGDTLHGVEIDKGLAQLSEALLTDLLYAEIDTSGIDLDGLVDRANTLELNKPDVLYDAVIGNPPYGRILRPTKFLRENFSSVISGGYVNLYALFIELALRWTRPGGVICLIVPMSFVGGPHFAALRKRILQRASVLRLDLIDKRSDVFLDVLYDLCVMVLRRHDGQPHPVTAETSLLTIDEQSRYLGKLELPARPSSHVWALPDSSSGSPLFQPGLTTLDGYGYLTRTGYFVWNREQHRYRVGKTPRSTEGPLFWAHNVRANKKCQPKDGDDGRIGFARIPQDSSAILRTDALILQRTSNRRQKRRLIAGIVRQADVVGGQGYVTENHTIVVMPKPTAKRLLPFSMLCRLLNTKAVDDRFRRMSGSVSVSTKALRDLPLPMASDVRRFFSNNKLSDDEAAEAAYAASIERAGRQAKSRKARRP